jgi:hypothetical protein
LLLVTTYDADILPFNPDNPAGKDSSFIRHGRPHRYHHDRPTKTTLTNSDPRRLYTDGKAWDPDEAISAGVEVHGAVMLKCNSSGI